MAQRTKIHSFHTVGWLMLIFSLPGIVLAQDSTSVMHLSPVEVTGEKISPFAIGVHTTTFDSALIKNTTTSTLSELLGNYSSISLKSYGNGMLSNISIRGTGSSHTAVLWHGINISYPMLGQSDLSVLSLTLADKVSIQYGNSSALYGTGAIGGTISLETNEPVRGINISVDQGIGSFGTLNSKIKTSISNDRYFLKWNALWDGSDNNFVFRNTTKIGSPTERQNGASYNILGSSLEAGLKFNKGMMIRFSGQYFNADRNLQPSMNVNTQGDTQSDENLRMTVAFSQKLNKHEWEVKYAYLHDVIGFNDDQTNSDQHVVRGKYNQQLSKAIRLNLGADYNFIKVQAPFYIEDNIEETRTNLWSSIMVNPVPRLILSVNLRQAFNPDYKIPFTSSFGSEYLAINSPSHQMTIKGSFAEGFRLPTLNERFWQPGGNPDIEPEESYSFEMGLDGTIKHNVEINYDLTAYRMWVDNWILWVPGGVYWSPENIKEVDAYGMEASGDIRHKIRGASIKWMANYALTRSINQTGLDSFDRSVGKQLAYVPVHKASFTALTNIKSWSFVMNASYTGKRYTTADNEEFLPAYTLLNLRIAKSFRWNKYQVNGCLSANNVLNTQYQSIENKAMPGINFSAGITINYHKL